jgi:branched-chain amino acid transport system permease protein
MIFWVLLSLTDNILNEAIDAGYVSSSVINNTQVGQFRFMLVGLLLMLLMIFRPQGILGDPDRAVLDD